MPAKANHCPELTGAQQQNHTFMWEQCKRPAAALVKKEQKTAAFCPVIRQLHLSYNNPLMLLRCTAKAFSFAHIIFCIHTKKRLTHNQTNRNETNAAGADARFFPEHAGANQQPDEPRQIEGAKPGKPTGGPGHG
ncbi:hypothetical protein [Paracnuella aquatica]|uniref:hypothetical protein n=1 Tax=Paracnuella aquatica TaxID=2268757 RepID=UPI001F4ECB2F|nr:hypothetical protein [Paracnuella aquatica]